MARANLNNLLNAYCRYAHGGRHVVDQINRGAQQKPPMIIVVVLIMKIVLTLYQKNPDDKF